MRVSSWSCVYGHLKLRNATACDLLNTWLKTVSSIPSNRWCWSRTYYSYPVFQSVSSLPWS